MLDNYLHWREKSAFGLLHSLRNLGVFMEERHQFKEYIDEEFKKAKQCSGFMFRHCKDIKDSNGMKFIYYSTASIIWNLLKVVK